VEKQQTGGRFSFSVVVADNDATKSAESVVRQFVASSSIRVHYCVQPEQNIALTRNAALSNAQGDFIAFIDDDEFPEPTWLAELLRTCQESDAAGVLGPVRPYFETPPPHWIIKGRFCERPEYPTGRVMDWEESRTGNLLFRNIIIAGMAQPFKPEFGTGGEDKDFFMRLTQAGHRFVWCNEAPAYETVPPSRWTRSYMLSRALLRGRNILKHPVGRAGIIARSIIAVPLYSLALPFLLLAGQHWFMRYCVKLCDHLGRLLALLGLHPIQERKL
jgi:cellulose synthase/poly-beta-1,6-N-acetylglucosamine synthase-like glycosyltransferase